MAISRILLPLNDRDDIAPVASLAFRLAKRFDAQVEGVFPQRSFLDHVFFPLESVSAFEIKNFYDKVQEYAEQAAEMTEAAFARLSDATPEVSTRFLRLNGQVEEAMARSACGADLMVLGNRAAYDSVFWMEVCDGALIHAGRPVIVAPSEPAAGGPGEHVMIAWKESTEISRAVAAAMPFIEEASRVTVVTVGGDEVDAASASRLQEFLELHGPKVDVENIAEPDGDIGQVLVDKATERPGTLLVMGAYSHARWRERAFGGVTEHVMRATKVPVLMAH